MSALHSEARVATPMARRYLTQLCKHFGHRLTVGLTAAGGSIEFPAGICRLVAEPDLLTLRAEADDEQRLGEVEHVIVHHLQRFAFRDTPAVDWMRA
jgi:hypothetical protein